MDRGDIHGLYTMISSLCCPCYFITDYDFGRNVVQIKDKLKQHNRHMHWALYEISRKEEYLE